MFDKIISILKKYNINTSNLVKLNTWYKAKSEALSHKLKVYACYYLIFEDWLSSKRIIVLEDLLGDIYLLVPLFKFTVLVIYLSF